MCSYMRDLKNVQKTNINFNRNPGDIKGARWYIK